MFSIDDDELKLCRHFVLNSIRANTHKFKPKFGKPVLCIDDTTYWRKSIFPQYKGLRKQKREDSKIDWQKLFKYKNQIIDELKSFYPGCVLQVKNCEADDIIAVLSRRAGENHIIVSKDTDFNQLQINNDVTIYDPISKTIKRSIYEDSTSNKNKRNQVLLEFHEKLIKGDRGDGIPNILTDDSALVNGIRSKSVTKIFIDKLLSGCNTTGEVEDRIITTQSTDVCNNWLRNRLMIDLNMIPNEIVSDINSAFDSYRIPRRDDFLNYMITNKLGTLATSLGEF